MRFLINQKIKFLIKIKLCLYKYVKLIYASEVLEIKFSHELFKS